jgi:hypothetical protein
VESVFRDPADGGAGNAAYRFAAFGDQRALADGEWQELLAQITRWERENGELAFLLDTGDVVHDGRRSDQFRWLTDEVLSIARHLPYLVGVGNHEVKNNADPAARENTARFLAYLDDDLAPDRLYYRKDLGPATFLFLDTNDLVYGPAGERGECPPSVAPDSREGRQLAWLRAQLEDAADRGIELVIAVLHHPPIQTSRKHREAARSLWSLRDGDRLFLDVLAEGGVDVILTGHTHTYERFRLDRSDGLEMDVVNLSGRPRESVFGIGAGARRAEDVRGREAEHLAETGWETHPAWAIRQEAVTVESDEANQFGLFTVEPDGRLFLRTLFLDEDEPGGLRASARVRLH